MTKTEKLRKIYTKKQIKVLKYFFTTFWLLIQHGAKRAGKTIGNNELFLLELKRVRATADKLNIPEPQYILSGHTLGTLQRNVLREIANRYGITFSLNKHNEFVLFGVRVCCFGHGTERDMDRIRGMTSFGAYVNEATTAVETVFREILNRCSGEGAKVIADTNPDDIGHFIKQDFIDKADGKRIIEEHYELDDNDLLSQEYKDNVKATTPSGVFYDRDIKGLWVNAEGMVYRDFNKDIHIIEEIPKDEEIIEYIIGVDWGFEHYGSIVVLGYTTKGNYYLIEEHTKKNMYVESYWLELAISLKEKYMILNKEPLFIVDSARSEYKNLFLDNNLDVVNATKKVIEGIEYVASLYKQNKLFILESGIDRFLTEIHSYVWHKNIGSEEKVKKTMDDCMDAIRYAIYTHMLMTR